MRDVDYEAVRKDLTLLMTDSKVTTIVILTSILEYFFEIPTSWKFDYKILSLMDSIHCTEGLLAGWLWSLWTSHGEVGLAQCWILQVVFVNICDGSPWSHYHGDHLVFSQFEVGSLKSCNSFQAFRRSRWSRWGPSTVIRFRIFFENYVDKLIARHNSTD